jgi:pimeloyl-ACP methyl ester carboxylesterase
LGAQWVEAGLVAFRDLSLSANGITFHAIADGPEDGPLVLLLHGFPELARSWSSQLPALASAGYHAVAPDLRGYGSSEKRGPYDSATLAKDAAELVRALGKGDAALVGHDWGGGMAYAAAIFQPEIVSRLVILNSPHPAVFARELVTNPRQLRHSWYMFFFQLPWVPEQFVTAGRARNVARALLGGSTVRTHWTQEEVNHYREAMLQPGAASAALGYYRAMFKSPLTLQRLAREHPIAAPTLILWGVEDRFLEMDLISPEKLSPWWAPDNAPEIRHIEGAGHFVQNEKPDQVSQELIQWLGRPFAG